MIKRLDNESDFDFIKRIVQGKLIDKTIDVDYSELSEIVFGKQFNSDEVRKRFYGINRIIEIIDRDKENIFANNDALNELELKKIELQKERKKIQTINVEYNKMLRESARHELIIENVRDTIPLVEVPKFKPLQLGQKNKQWVLAFSDLHFDKFFESVNNDYSVEEFYRRMNLLLSKTIEEVQQNKIDKIIVLNLGDSFEGLLRISALKTMRVGLITSIIQLSRFLSEWLNTLSEVVEVTYYHVPTANHSEIRTFSNNRGETDENLELLVVNYIHDTLKNNKRVNIVLPNGKDYISFKIFDYNILATHGDGVKNIRSSLQDYSMLHRVFYDYLFMGHYHSSQEISMYEGRDNNMEIIIAPSIVGSDTYSDTLFVGSKSSAKLFGFTDGEGKTDVKTFILN